MTNDDLIKIGFEAIPTYTVGNGITYKLSRNRQISGNCIGTPNEILFICEISDNNESLITDLVILHNYDYDGYLTIEKVQKLIDAITMTGSKKSSK